MIPTSPIPVILFIALALAPEIDRERLLQLNRVMAVPLFKVMLTSSKRIFALALAPRIDRARPLQVGRKAIGVRILALARRIPLQYHLHPRHLYQPSAPHFLIFTTTIY